MAYSEENKMNKEEKIKDFTRIRKKFQASRKQFGEVFVGKSEQSLNFYERGMTEIPDSVMMLARIWESFLDKMRGEQAKCRKK